MKVSRRTSVVILILVLLVLLGILFRTFILTNFVTPAALVLWVFWRVLQSVDQKVYWVGLIFAGSLYIFVRLTRETGEAEKISWAEANATLENVRSWRISILMTRDESDRPNLLTNNLRSVLSAIYAVKQPDVIPYRIYDALNAHQIPVPHRIYNFLFQAKPSGKRSLRQVLESIRGLPVKWYRHWIGRDVVEYYQKIEEVIDFMESLMENKHDDEPIDSHND
jgi:hypothetical protein